MIPISLDIDVLSTLDALPEPAYLEMPIKLFLFYLHVAALTLRRGLGAVVLLVLGLRFAIGCKAVLAYVMTHSPVLIQVLDALEDT